MKLDHLQFCIKVGLNIELYKYNLFIYLKRLIDPSLHTQIINDQSLLGLFSTTKRILKCIKIYLKKKRFF